MRANSDKLQTFPLGMNALFAVTLHDNIGRTFAVASIPLKYRLNRQVKTIIIIVKKINVNVQRKQSNNIQISIIIRIMAIKEFIKFI